METSQSLSVLYEPFGIILGIGMIAVTTVLSWMAWTRSGLARGTGILESLRLMIVILVAITLIQPEWLEKYVPHERPTLVVLHDVSGSMDTQDVLDPKRPSEAPITRRESIEPLVTAEPWSAIEDRLEIVTESFSSASEITQQGTDVNAALEGAMERHPNLRGIVLMSDGDWNLGQPPIQAASRLRMKNIPVFAIGTGSETRLPDIELARLDAPTFGVVHKTMRIPFVITSALPRDYRTTVTLTPTSGKAVSKEITIEAMSQLDDAITWKPEQTGKVTLTMNVPRHEQEFLESNNRRSVPIDIRDEALKVLVIESFPRWEYRYLRNAWERDPGVEASCLLFHPGLSKVGGGKGYLKSFPESQEELAKYDVIFLGDVGVGEGHLTLRQCQQIKGLVQSQASGLVLMPGIRGHQLSLLETELEELFPVVLDTAQPRGWGSRVPAQMQLTETGRRSLLTKLEDSEDENSRTWETLPGFQWFAAVERAKAGSEVLAIHNTQANNFGRIPLLATKTFGTGKILFMGTDGAWRWREGVEDKYHYRFWGQVVRWMAYQRNMAQGKTMRLFYAPDRPMANHSVSLNANVMSLSGEPLQDGNVVVRITAPSGKIETVRLAPTSDEWGLFTGTFTPTEHGSYNLMLSCRQNQSTLETTLSVHGVLRERRGQPARYDVLKEIATVSRGKMADPSDLGQLIQEIKSLPEPEPLVRRLRLWCHPVWAGAIVLLLGVFWTGRKMVGTI